MCNNNVCKRFNLNDQNEVNAYTIVNSRITETILKLKYPELTRIKNLFNEFTNSSNDTSKSIVSDARVETFESARPKINKLIEYNPVIVIIPERIGGILHLVDKRPVIRPPTPPPITARIVATTGLIAFKKPEPKLIERIKAQIHAPRGKVPSIDRSAISKIRYEIWTPSVMILKIIPSLIPVKKKLETLSIGINDNIIFKNS